MIRKINNVNYNCFLKNGVQNHKPTKIVPDSLIKPLQKEEIHNYKMRYKIVEKDLTSILGTPYFSDNGFILYNSDCCEILPLLQQINIKIDLTVTSPPYNIGKEYEEIMEINDYINWCAKWVKYIFKITKAEGSFWLNVGYFEVPGRGLCVPMSYLLWNKSPFYMIQEIVWNYGAGVSAKRRLSPRNEKWLFYVKNSKNYTFNLDDIRNPNVKYPNQKKNGKFRCNPLGKNPSDVWEFPKVTTGTNRSSRERTGHPAQFPLKVIERIIKASSNIYDLVLDPFSGSCSAGIAAVSLGRLFLGIEINEYYCELAVDRYINYKKKKEALLSQATLF